MSTMKNVGIFYVEFIELYGATATDASWIFFTKEITATIMGNISIPYNNPKWKHTSDQCH